MKVTLGNVFGVLTVIEQAMNLVQSLKKSGQEKKAAAIDLTQRIITLVEGVAGKDYITDPLVVAAVGSVMDAVKTLENVIADVKARRAAPTPPGA